MKTTTRQVHADNLVWADFETTGLPNDSGFEPLEVAVVVTDPTATEVLWESGSLVISPKDLESALGSMGDYVSEMHAKTGLIDRLRAGEGMSLGVADGLLSKQIGRFFPERGAVLADGSKFRGAILAGSSVGQFDGIVLRQFFPEWQKLMSYRVLDVSSVENMVKRSFPTVHESLPEKGNNHTATRDIAESIRQYRHYIDGLA
ncbi:oligoribonuclease [Glutamicibacter ardleyensis]|uniref:oligoribonuclease n=1 Tax=Glutamicibacter ardleyensis TaxID=225894 RepID=UPI003FD66189